MICIYLYLNTSNNMTRYYQLYSLLLLSTYRINSTLKSLISSPPSFSFTPFPSAPPHLTPRPTPLPSRSAWLCLVPNGKNKARHKSTALFLPPPGSPSFYLKIEYFTISLCLSFIHLMSPCQSWLFTELEVYLPYEPSCPSFSRFPLRTASNIEKLFPLYI